MQPWSMHDRREHEDPEEAFDESPEDDGADIPDEIGGDDLEGGWPEE